MVQWAWCGDHDCRETHRYLLLSIVVSIAFHCFGSFAFLLVIAMRYIADSANFALQIACIFPRSNFFPVAMRSGSVALAKRS